jgi:very-short-patch-repair endonuclease
MRRAGYAEKGPLPPCGGGTGRGGLPMPHHNVSRRGRGTAKRLRRNLTDAERALWHVIRAHRFEGVGFRRQMPIGPYVVDFVAHRMRLVIEVDGGQHHVPDGLEADRIRDEWLAGRGYRVLRFSNLDVLQNLDGVAATITAALPPSQPSPARGEGYEPVPAVEPVGTAASGCTRGRMPC